METLYQRQHGFGIWPEGSQQVQVAELQSYLVSLCWWLSWNFHLRLAQVQPVPPLIVRTRLLEVRLHPKHTYAPDWFTAITTESLKMFSVNGFLQRRCPTMHVSCLDHPLAND